MADSTYILGIAAALRSVLESLKEHVQAADIFLVDLGLEPIEKQQLGLMVNSFSETPQPNTTRSQPPTSTSVDLPAGQQLISLSWLTPTSAQVAQLPLAAGTHAGAATWAKLLLPELLPCTLGGWVLYLDSDVLVTPGTDLAEIWQEAESAAAAAAAAAQVRAALSSCSAGTAATAAPN
jgi:lipopolysaccharide biosynthesis glycosyltransferase